jgi:chorismate-pyruvate lyase
MPVTPDPMPSPKVLANSTSQQMEVTYPLNEFYQLAGKELPRIEAVDGEKMPQPYKRLLVHRRDMTSTLETFHRGRVHVAPFSRRREGDFYFRNVLLALNESERPVEFGAIKINLALFEEKARRLILDEQLPLGRILQEQKIAYASRPRAFLRVFSDELMNSHLQLTEAQWLYGRRNTLTNPQGEAMAEIVEILPP